MVNEKKVRALIEQLSNYKKANSAEKKLLKLNGPLTKSLLIEALGDSDKSELVKMGAAKILGIMKDAHAVEPLITMLDGKFSSSVIKAIEALGAIGDTRAVEPLIKVLYYEDGSLRRAAAKALTDLGDPIWESVIKGDQNDYDRMAKTRDLRVIEFLILSKNYSWSSYIRKATAETLGQIQDPRSNELLLIMLNDHSDNVVVKAAFALGELQDSRASEPLIKILATDTHAPETIICLAQVLLKLKNPIAVSSLIKFLGHYDEKVRKATAEALNELDEPVWSSLVTGDNDDFNRLRKSNDPRTVEPLLYSLRWKQDISTVYTLGELKNPIAAEPLVKVLCNRKGDLRTAASEALDKLGEPQWRDFIKGDEEDFVRLAESKDSRIAEPLMDFLIPELGSAERFKHDDETIINNGKTRNGNEVYSSISVIRKQPSLDDSNPYVEALVKLGDPRMVKPLIEIVKNSKFDHHYHARKDAAWVLIRLAEMDQSIRLDEDTIEKISSPNSYEIFTYYDSTDSTGYSSSRDVGIGFDISKTALGRMLK